MTHLLGNAIYFRFSSILFRLTYSDDMVTVKEKIENYKTFYHHKSADHSNMAYCDLLWHIGIW